MPYENVVIRLGICAEVECALPLNDIKQSSSYKMNAKVISLQWLMLANCRYCCVTDIAESDCFIDSFSMPHVTKRHSCCVLLLVAFHLTLTSLSVSLPLFHPVFLYLNQEWTEGFSKS